MDTRSGAGARRSLGAPVIPSFRDLDDYEVAELVRKKTETSVTDIVFVDDEAQQGISPYAANSLLLPNMRSCV